MDSLLDLHYALVKTPSDIQGHLQTLYNYAARVDSAAEFGCRDAFSDISILAGMASRDHADLMPTMYAYDIHECVNGLTVKEAAAAEGIKWLFYREDDRRIELPVVDMLLIDTYHEYELLDEELSLHAKKVLKWIIIHDTNLPNEDCGHSMNMWIAILKLVNGAYPGSGKWVIKENFRHCNGLTILERVE